MASAPLSLTLSLFIFRPCTATTKTAAPKAAANSFYGGKYKREKSGKEKKPAQSSPVQSVSQSPPLCTCSLLKKKGKLACRPCPALPHSLFPSPPYLLRVASSFFLLARQPSSPSMRYTYYYVLRRSNVISSHTQRPVHTLRWL